MALLLDEDQQAIEREAQRIVEAASDTATLLALIEQPGEYDRPMWQLARDNGWCAISVAEQFGGLGLGLSEVGLVCQALGSAPAGVPFVLTGHAVCVGLGACANASLAAEWLPQLARGDAIGAVAFADASEPLPRNPIVKFHDGRLYGVKQGVLAGTHADCALVLAQADSGPVLVLTELAEVQRSPVASYDPTRGHAALRFDDTPAKMVADGDSAWEIARLVTAHMAVAAAYEQLGGAEALLWQGRDYANTRKAFGQPIGAFQAVKHRIAELYGLIEIARANCAIAAEQADKPTLFAAAATARLAATEAYDAAARDIIQIHGGIGVTWDLGLHLHMRRARSMANDLGHAIFWEDMLVDELTRGGA